MSRFGTELEREMQRIRPPGFDVGDLTRRRARRDRWRRIQAAAVAVAVAGSGAALLARSFSSGGSLPGTEVRPHVVSSFSVGPGPSGNEFADGSLWIGHRKLREVWRVDALSGVVQARIPSGSSAPTAVAAGDGEVWAVAPSTTGSTLLRIEPASNAVVASFPVAVIGNAIAVGDGRVWVASETSRTVLVLSTTGRRLARVPVSGAPSAIALDRGGAWTVGALDGALTRITVPGFRGAVVAQVTGRPTGVAECLGAPWVSTGGGSVVSVDPRSGEVTATPRGRFITAVAPAGTVLWAADGSGNEAIAIDCATGRVLGRVAVGEEPTGVVARAGGAWVLETAGGRVSVLAT